MRSSWIKPRLGKENVTQMNFARNGYITEEMDFVAKKENLPASLIKLPCFEKITSAKVYVATAKAFLKSKSILLLIDLHRYEAPICLYKNIS